MEIDDGIEIKEIFTKQFKQIQKQVTSILNEEIKYFPIRHHSPICAYHVKNYIVKNNPKLIFLEIPSNFNEFASFIVDKETIPPIALYSSLKDENNVYGANGIITANKDIPAKFQSWYPLADYSPEYQVIKLAYEKNIPIIFFDLPYYLQLYYLLERKKEYFPKTRNLDLLWNSSDFIRKFVTNSDYSNFNEVWDSLFEIQGLKQTTEEFITNLLLFACSARSMIPEESLISDTTVIREKYMRWIMDKEINNYKIKKKDVMVVSGAFHCIKLPLLKNENNNFFSKKLNFTILNSIVPFSFYSLSELSGYGAGNQAPYYFDNIWKKLKKSNNPYYDEALNIINRTIKNIRVTKELMSSADVIAAFQTSILLANLRKRDQPILTDIKDALVTCCVKGRNDFEGKIILKSFEKYVIGQKVGKVTSKLSTTPLSHDFYLTMEILGIKKSSELKVYSFSLLQPSPQEMAISAFFHTCKFLEIPLVKCLSSQELTSKSEIFKEEWNVQWSSNVDKRLLELNLYGTTVDSATAGLLKEKVEENKERPHNIVILMFNVFQFRKVELVPQILKSLSTKIAITTNFISLGNAFNYLVMFNNYAINRDDFQTIIPLVKDIIVETFSRCCYELPNIANINEEMIDEIIDILYSLIDNAISLNIDLDLDFELLIQMANASMLQSRNHIIKGALVGVLSKINEISPNEIQTFIINYSKSSEKEAKNIGNFLLGLLSVSKSLLLDIKVFEAINIAIIAPDSKNFVKIVPNLLKCFSSLSEMERRSVLDRVISMKEKKPLTEKLELETIKINKNFLEKIENEVFDIIGRWDI